MKILGIKIDQDFHKKFILMPIILITKEWKYKSSYINGQNIKLNS